MSVFASDWIKKKIFSILELDLKYNTDVYEISSTQSANVYFYIWKQTNK